MYLWEPCSDLHLSETRTAVWGLVTTETAAVLESLAMMDNCSLLVSVRACEGSETGPSEVLIGAAAQGPLPIALETALKVMGLM